MGSASDCLVLNSGYKMPLVGLGTWQSSEEEVGRAVEAALEAGYRMIDTAHLYKNEAAIGRVLNQWLTSGRVTREELFITTKLPPPGLHPERVTQFCQESLKNLGLSYVDLYLIHTPVGMKYSDNPEYYGGAAPPELDMTTDLEKIWTQMEEQVKAGRVRSIGISNFTRPQVDRILKVATIKPANHQVELHAYMQQLPIREQCKQYGIAVTSYASLGSPGRIEPMVFNKDSSNIMKNPVVETIAKAHNKEPVHILLKHLLQHGVIIIPKSITPARIKQNLELFDFTLSAEEMNSLDGLDKGAEGRSFDFKLMLKGYDSHPEYPFGQY